MPNTIQSFQSEQSSANPSFSIPQADPEQNDTKANSTHKLIVCTPITTNFKMWIAMTIILTIVVILIKIDSYFTNKLNQNSNLAEQPQSRNVKASFFIESQINQKIKDVLSSNRFYDIHTYIKDDHFQQKHLVLQEAQKQLISQRKLLNFTQTNVEIETLIKILRKQNFSIEGQDRSVFRKKYFDLQLAHDAYFFSELQKNPNRHDYLEAEFYRYDKKYNISQYGDELPLCAIMIGKNNKKVIKKMYESIENQNYTNYKVIHVDDNSNDGTIQEVQGLIKNSSVLSKRVTLIVQPRQMNSLYNRNFSYSFCGEDDIIIDMDSDDWLIGKQVFQLVNTVYQQGGNTYNKSEQTDTWAVYFNLIKYGHGKTYYYLKGNVPLKVIQRQSYRVSHPIDWRTTHLRTFLHKIYNKVDTKDFIDPMTEQFFLIRQDTFIQSAIFELSAPRHIKFIDQFVYFYQEFAGKKDLDFVKYAQKMARTLPPYYQLENLDDNVTRNYAFVRPKNLLDEKKVYTERAKIKYEAAKKQIVELIEAKRENQKDRSNQGSDE